MTLNSFWQNQNYPPSCWTFQNLLPDPQHWDPLQQFLLLQHGHLQYFIMGCISYLRLFAKTLHKFSFFLPLISLNFLTVKLLSLVYFLVLLSNFLSSLFTIILQILRLLYCLLLFGTLKKLFWQVIISISSKFHRFFQISNPILNFHYLF